MVSRIRSRTAAPLPRGEAFVQAVLDVTLTRLAEVGYERLSIPDVATRVGANKTSLYRRWPGKAELVRDALAAAMSHADSPSDTGDLRGDLLGLAAAVAGFMQTPAGMAVVRVLLAEAGHPLLRQLALQAYGELGRHGPGVALARAVQRGELRPGQNLAQVLFTVAGAVMHRVFVEQDSPTPAFLEQVVDLVLFGAAVQRPAVLPGEPGA